MSSCVCSVNDSGSAPNFSWLARARADSMVKLPVMLAWPSVIAACVVGARDDQLVEDDGELVLRRPAGRPAGW